MKKITFVALLLVTALGAASADDAERAKALFLSWVADSGIPGEYTTEVQRREKDTHPGDLVGTPIFSTNKHGAFDFDNGNGQWSHTKPNQIFTENPGESNNGKKKNKTIILQHKDQPCAVSKGSCWDAPPSLLK